MRVQSCGLIDLGYLGPALMWRNGRKCATNIKKKLDRNLCNTDWRMEYPEATVKHLARTYFDHYPILLEMKGIGDSMRIERLVRFELACLSHL